MNKTFKLILKESRKTKKRSIGKVAGIALLIGVGLSATSCSSPEQRLEKLYNSGQEFLAEGDLGRANVQFRNVLKIDEQHVPTLVAMTEIAERRQDLKRIFALSQRIVRIDPNNIGARVKLGQLHLIASDETAALEQADAVLAIDPENTGGMALKAGILLKLGDTQGAVDLANQVVALDPANPEATTVIATSLAMKDDFDGALAELDRALEIEPKTAVLQLLRIQLLAQLERDDDVVEGLKRLVDLFPEEPTYRRAYAADLIKKEQYSEAKSQLEAVAEFDPDSLDAKLDIVRIVNKIGGADAALERLNQFIKADPENSDLKFALVDFYRQQNEWEKAESTLNPLIDDDDVSVASQAKNTLATLRVLQGDRESAAKVIDELLAADDSNTDALIKRAGFRIEKKQYDEAIADLRTALGNDPESSKAMLLMAAALEQQGNMDLARAELAKAFDVSQKDAVIANYFAKFLLRDENPVRAEDILEQSIAVNSRHLDNLKLLAAVRLDQQDWRGAEEVATIIESLGNQPDEDAAQNIRTLALTGLGDNNRLIETLSAQQDNAPLASAPLATLVKAYVQEGRDEEAVALLTKINTDDPENYSANILLAQVLNKNGDAAAAEKVLLAATQTTPDRPEAYELLYRSYIRTGQKEQAMVLVDDGLQKTPESPALRFFKADILLNQGDLEGALDLYSGLIEDRPNDKIIANNFTSLTSDLRQDQASIERALEVASILKDETRPSYRDTLGWVHYRAGQFDQAVTYLTEAVEASPNQPEFLYHLGAAQIASGDTVNGKESLQKALELGGENFRFKSEVQNLLKQE